MNQITFEYTSLANQKFSPSMVTRFVIKGRNHGLPLKVKSHTTSCGCTSVKIPDIVDGEFNLIILVDKKNQSGFTSQSVNIIFENGEKHTIYVSGTIKD